MSAIEQPAVKVGQDGRLRRRRHDVGHFGHEMHAAEDDELRIRLRGEPRQLQRIPVRSACWFYRRAGSGGRAARHVAELCPGGADTLPAPFDPASG